MDSNTPLFPGIYRAFALRPFLFRLFHRRRSIPYLPPHLPNSFILPSGRYPIIPNLSLISSYLMGSKRVSQKQKESNIHQSINAKGCSSEPSPFSPGSWHNMTRERKGTEEGKKESNKGSSKVTTTENDPNRKKKVNKRTVKERTRLWKTLNARQVSRYYWIAEQCKM